MYITDSCFYYNGFVMKEQEKRSHSNWIGVMIISDIHISTQRLKKYNFGGFVTSFCSYSTSVGFLTSFSSDLHLEVLLHLFVVMLHLEEW